jgi:heterodisulfide reductase subunit A
MSKPEMTKNDAAQRVGVYFLRTAEDKFAAPDVQNLHEYASHLAGVQMVRTLTVSGALKPEDLARELRQEKLNTVVLAAEHPGFFQPAFASALALAGADGSRVRLASFGERGDGGSADRAKGVIAAAVQGVPFDLPPKPAMPPVFNTETLVIGGGIAGIQAALEIAESGHKVFLVERTGTVGGRMAMFDKTFPTLDCAACILTPKMVAVGQSKNIEILVLSEVTEVTGSVGNFTVKVFKKTAYVDASACVACGDCAQFCPMTTSSEFDMGIANRKGIFIPFPQAVPNTYMINRETCNYLQSGGTKCGVCAKKCSKDAIHFDAKDETIELKVGNIIVATGYDTLDPKRVDRYGYGKYPNILTSLEFERLTNASGPTGGKIAMKVLRTNKKTKAEEWVFEADGPKPKAVAVIHCVGSRDKNYNSYCSRVCCMYSLKFAHLVREKVPDAKCYEFYIDMRAFGKGYEEFHERIREEGVYLVRGRSNGIVERDGQMYVHGEDIATNSLIDIPVDMVVLSVGLQPSKGSDEVAAKLNIPRDENGWFRELNYNAEPNSTGRDGIYLAGVCQGPKDIPDTVAQASAAAAYVLGSIVGATGREAKAEEKAGTPARS